ncbi:MAG TPA: TPM domain-containing protein [Candidatus Polarisedimenticolaceae bacterium]|nr:TPM domain-containing protein [Candidatus Polarisedimenticolaceae bacterium]
MALWRTPLRKLLDEEDESRVLAAIRSAEQRTSGEIRVHVERRCEVDAMEAGRRWFSRLGMDATADRNGILFYVAVDDRRFAIVGDTGIHAKVGEAFWNALRDAMAEEFAKGNPVAGLVRAIGEAGERLAEHFPRSAGDRNELSDEISG